MEILEPHISVKRYIPIVTTIALLNISFLIGQNEPFVMVAGFITSISTGFSIYMWQIISENKRKNLPDLSTDLEKEAQNDFITMVNHEFRTPLTAIHASIGVLMKNKSLSDKTAEIVAHTFKTSEQLTSILNHHLETEQFELRLLRITTQKVSLLNMAQETDKSTYDKFVDKMKNRDFNPKLGLNEPSSVMKKMLSKLGQESSSSEVESKSGSIESKK